MQTLVHNSHRYRVLPKDYLMLVSQVPNWLPQPLYLNEEPDYLPAQDDSLSLVSSIPNWLPLIYEMYIYNTKLLMRYLIITSTG